MRPGIDKTAKRKPSPIRGGLFSMIPQHFQGGHIQQVNIFVIQTVKDSL